MDELLKLCNDATEEASSQLALQAKALNNEKSDPIKEDMFKRKIDHMNQDKVRKQHHSGNQEFNFDQLHHVMKENDSVCHYLTENDVKFLVLSTWV